MEFTAQNAEYAVAVFYNGEQNDRASAHNWLTTAQKVPEAWNFVWELLQPTKSTEVQFYAATTLHTKILRCWNEVPPESYDELIGKLLQAVYTYAKGPKIVTNRLCISLAAFILQHGDLDLATILRPLSTVENSTLLLEVLTVIPEEFNSMTMGYTHHCKNRVMLQRVCPAVLDDMLQRLHSVYDDFSNKPPTEQQLQDWIMAANCANSWLVDGMDEDIGSPLPDRIPLFRALLTVVHVLYSCNEIVSDTALDACEACLTCARAAGDGGNAYRHPKTGVELMASLAALAAPIMQKENVPNSPNEELVSALMTCCVALGVAHAKALVDILESDEDTEHANGTRKLVEILLEAQGAPGYYPIQETRSNLIFGFWYTLQDHIVNVFEKDTIKHIWHEVFTRLLSILVSKSEAPDDSALSKDDYEMLRCYRQDIADTLMYCYSIVGEWCWSRVESSYIGAETDARREAALHVFSALADAAPHERAPPALSAMLRHTVNQARVATDPRLLHTALDILGSYALWLSSVSEGVASDPAELARECMQAAGDALRHSPPAAALALRKLCTDCPAPAATLAPHIVRAAMNSRGQEAWTRRQLMSAAGAALAAAEPGVAAPLLQELAASLHMDLAQQAVDPSSSSGVAECTASLFASMTNRPELAADLFRTLANTLPPYALNPTLVESLFSILKQAVSVLLVDILPVVEQIAELTAAGCTHHPCASGLDVVKLIILVSGREWAGARGLLRACTASSVCALAPHASAKPDLAEGLFTLLTAITKKTPHYLEWIDDILPQLVELGCTCIRLWEVGAARAACWWLAALAAHRPAALQPAAPHLTEVLLRCIGCTCIRLWEVGAARAACWWLAALAAHRPAALQPAAPHLTEVLLRCIGGGSPRNQMDPLGEVLLALNRATWQGADLGTWLRASLAAPDFPTPHATDAYKHKFIAAVVKEKSSKRRLLENVAEFSLVCRGLIGTEYARQSMLAKRLMS